MNGLVYCYENTINGKFYVGQTLEDTCQKRFQDHEKAKSGCKVFNLAMRKYGKEAFVRRILEDNVPIEDGRILLGQLEQFWVEALDSYHNGYNMTTGGELNKRFKHSEEVKRKIAEHSPKVWLGKNLSAETKAKIAEARRNQAPLTEEQEAQRQASLRKAYAEGRREVLNAVKLIRLDTLETFESAQKFIDAIGYGSAGSVRSVIRRNHHKPTYFLGIPVALNDGTYTKEKADATWASMSKQRCKRLVRCVETGEIFNSMLQAVGKALSADLPDAIKRGRPLKGYHWEYVAL